MSKFKYNGIANNLDVVIDKASELKTSDGRNLQEVLNGLSGSFVFRGDIFVASDFPTLDSVKNGDTYIVKADVVDNDATKTNTNMSFTSIDIISWNGTYWSDITGIEIFKEDGIDVKTYKPNLNLDLQGKDLKNTGKINFNTITPSLLTNPGDLAWNSDEKTLDLLQNGTTLQIGQETQYNVRNTSGTQVNNGTLVMSTGTIGNSGRITVSPMNGTVITNTKLILGVATENILDTEDGKVTNFGKIREIDTTGTLSFGGLETWNDGDILYVDTINAGGYLTNVKPTTGMIVPVAIVIHSHTAGTLFVRITPINEDFYTTKELYTKIELDAGQLDNRYYTETETNSLLDTKINLTEKGQANGVATLGADSKIPTSQLPSYVDVVLEYADLASFPATGETGKIYIALDTNYSYRWGGSSYIEIADGKATWGGIDGDLSNQTDLQNALNNKLSLSGTEDIKYTSISSNTSSSHQVNAGSGTTIGELQAHSSLNQVLLGSRTNTPLILRTNLIERMRIDSAGNVGIGNTNPDKPLDVNGNARVNALYIGKDFSDRGSTGEDNLYIRQEIKTAGGWWGTRIEIEDETLHTAPFYPYDYIDKKGSLRKWGIDKHSNMFFRNTTSVPATNGNGGTLYVEGGALKFKGSFGTVTTIANA